MIEDNDEPRKRLKRAEKLRHTISRPKLEKDRNDYIKGCFLDCLEWLQSLHEGFKCTGNLIPCPFDLEKVWVTMKRQGAGGRFVTTVGQW
jgi:hypothetical protein